MDLKNDGECSQSGHGDQKGLRKTFLSLSSQVKDLIKESLKKQDRKTGNNNSNNNNTNNNFKYCFFKFNFNCFLSDF